jgi:hypothetical protein
MQTLAGESCRQGQEAGARLSSLESGLQEKEKAEGDRETVGIIVFGVVAGIYALVRGYGAGRRSGLKRMGRLVPGKDKASSGKAACQRRTATDTEDKA